MVMPSYLHSLESEVVAMGVIPTVLVNIRFSCFKSKVSGIERWQRGGGAYSGGRNLVVMPLRGVACTERLLL